MPRPALRGGTDEGLHQLAIIAERIGENRCLGAALRSFLLFNYKIRVSSGEDGADRSAASYGGSDVLRTECKCEASAGFKGFPLPRSLVMLDCK
jgi:hypothetical protein